MLQSWYIQEYEEQSQNARHFGTDHYFFPCWGRGWRFCFWAGHSITTSIEFKRTWDTVEKLFQVIVLRTTLLLMRNFGSAFGSSLHSPTSPRRCCDPKQTNFHPICAIYYSTLFGVGRQFYYCHLETPNTIGLGRHRKPVYWQARILLNVCYCTSAIHFFPAVFNVHVQGGYSL